MRLESLHVIVVGAAMGGTTTALLLARAGARVTLLERVANLGGAGAGIALAENGRAVLAGLGLGPALTAARPMHGMRVTDAAGRTLLAPPPETPTVRMFRRAALHEALLDAIAREPRVTVRLGCEVRSASSVGDVEMDDGTTATRERLNADVVIGADGVRSCVRQHGTFAARVTRTGIRYLRALVGDDRAMGVEAWTAAGLFGSFAVDSGTYLFASCGTPALRAALATRDLGALRTIWAAAYPPAGPLLAAVPRFDDLLVNEVVCVKCARWHDGRLVLLGDAAHAMAPNLGQGANSALVDAAVLVDALRRAATLGEALRAYDARRRPAVQRVADASARLGRLAEATHPLVRALRDRVVLPVAARLATPRAAASVLQEPSDVLEAMVRQG